MSNDLSHHFPQATTEPQEAPNNLEAEQALLGAILANNEAMNHVAPMLAPNDFYAELHQRIFEAILFYRDKNQVANPLTMKRHFAGQGVEDQYLARLVGAATSIINVHDYSMLVWDASKRRQIIGACEETILAVKRPDELDAITHLEMTEQKLFAIAQEGTREGGFEAVNTSVKTALERAEHAFKHTGQVLGLDTGYSGINHITGGLHPSDLLILAGRPSMGKTALATNIARNVAGGLPAGQSVGIFSLEMSADQLSHRMICGEAGVNSSTIAQGRATDEEMQRFIRASRVIGGLPIYIDATPALTISALRSRARRLKRQKNIQLIVVDYLQLIHASADSRRQGRVQEVSEITAGLKAIQKELGITVLALSQLSREVEKRDDKRPQLADLRDSGSIEQDADIVMFVYREEYYVGRNKPPETDPRYQQWAAQHDAVKGLAEVIIAKHRNGPIGNVEMSFNGATTMFRDKAEGY